MYNTGMGCRTCYAVATHFLSYFELLTSLTDLTNRFTSEQFAKLFYFREKYYAAST